MAQQSSREFASTDPTTRIQGAGFQVSGVSPKISLNSCSHLEHFQRPTSSHFCKDAPSLSRVGYEHVARGSRGRLKIFGTQNSRVLLSTLIQRRLNCSPAHTFRTGVGRALMIGPFRRLRSPAPPAAPIPTAPIAAATPPDG